MLNYEWKKCRTLIRPGDHGAYFVRYQPEDQTVWIISGDMFTRRVNCRSIMEAQDEIRRVLENKRALIDIYSEGK